MRLPIQAIAALFVFWPVAAPAGGYTATVTRIGALTGPHAPVDMKGPDVCGTDLGTTAEIDGTVIFAFGDTFGWKDGSCERFGPDWRSNVLAFTTDTDPSDGISIERWYTKGSGKAIAVAEGGHAPAREAVGETASEAVFLQAFKEAKRRVRRMEFRFIEEGDPMRQALLEIYCVTSLAVSHSEFA